MKISEHFSLGKSQFELDFVDVDTGSDIPLFIDPKLLSTRQDKWSRNAHRTLGNFFSNILEKIREGKSDVAKEDFVHLSEPNETCLGLSIGKPQGRGVGPNDAENIFESILLSGAVESNILQDVEDSLLFIDGFGRDKLSDLTTNIIKKHLVEYTQEQCKLHGILLTGRVPFWYWDTSRGIWLSDYFECPIISGRKILLTPKSIVSYSMEYTPEKYYNNFVLNFLQQEHLNKKTRFVHKRKNGDTFVLKKELKETYIYSKSFLREFTEKHPELLTNFKEIVHPEPLTNEEINGLSGNDSDQLPTILEALAIKLESIPLGTPSATEYHNTMLGILELLFYPSLVSPVKEDKLHEGRKRIDITFQNASEQGIFYRLPTHYNIHCGEIYLECKNYSSDPANPEIDQLSGRFGPHRGRVGILLCRQIENMEHFMKRCSDTYHDGRGLIIPITDEDIMGVLSEFENDKLVLERLLAERFASVMKL